MCAKNRLLGWVFYDLVLNPLPRNVPFRSVLLYTYKHYILLQTFSYSVQISYLILGQNVLQYIKKSYLNSFLNNFFIFVV